jgi:hypothetical protein
LATEEASANEGAAADDPVAPDEAAGDAAAVLLAVGDAAVLAAELRAGLEVDAWLPAGRPAADVACAVVRPAAPLERGRVDAGVPAAPPPPERCPRASAGVKLGPPVVPPTSVEPKTQASMLPGFGW